MSVGFDSEDGCGSTRAEQSSRDDPGDRAAVELESKIPMLARSVCESGRSVVAFRKTVRTIHDALER